MIGKLFCGVSSTVLNLIHSYLTNRTQRINNSFSRRSSIEYGVLQGSVLGSLFDIDLIDLFYWCEDSSIANYAEDKTPYRNYNH